MFFGRGLSYTTQNGTTQEGLGVGIHTVASGHNDLLFAGGSFSDQPKLGEPGILIIISYSLLCYHIRYYIVISSVILEYALLY